ncbi:diphosphomevalonate decarboxylase [Acholeplasma equirhinis]|uniref:diphosphomevalonate decarboxylase n=1 Tax=Acholeplasma equirhinis TaxID=555393 RepID=UPI00197A9E0E|nr:diphosphomevalonate decarboxylase [Acholeplasma equirhinis]MBN3490464.1 diphosphomevalonate decarboxylase [Acholeplasma equirhinis]
MKKTAKAHVNIALIKYWGKKDKKWNLPLTSSLSFTVDKFYTKTSVEYKPLLTEDHLYIDDKFITGPELERVKTFMDMVRHLYNIPYFAEIISYNYVPKKAGIASSSSAFAALALAATESYDIHLEPKALSALARFGSGSAARSIYDGFSIWHEGYDHITSFAEPIKGFSDMAMLICMVDQREKKIDSRSAMNVLEEFPELKSDWISKTNMLLNDMVFAINQVDFEAMGKTAELHATLMHELISKTGVKYLNETSHEILDLTKWLRSQGHKVYATMDAGPNVKIIVKKENIKDVISYYEKICHVVVCYEGKGVHLL